MVNIFASINMKCNRTIKGLKNRVLEEFVPDDTCDDVVEQIADNIIWRRGEDKPPPYYSARYSKLERKLYTISVLDRLWRNIEKKFDTKVYGMKLFLFINGTFFLPKHSEPFIQDLFIIMFGNRKICIGDRKYNMMNGDGLYVPFEQNISGEIYIPPDNSINISFIVVTYIDTPYSIKLNVDKPLVKVIDENIDQSIVEMIKNPFMGYIGDMTF